MRNVENLLCDIQGRAGACQQHTSATHSRNFLRVNWLRRQEMMPSDVIGAVWRRRQRASWNYRETATWRVARPHICRNCRFHLAVVNRHKISQLAIANVLGASSGPPSLSRLAVRSFSRHNIVTPHRVLDARWSICEYRIILRYRVCPHS